MKAPKKISVIVPVYNVEKYLRKCVDSLLMQTIDDFQIYLVDDGSTDSSGIICDSLSKEYSNITVFHKKNGGLSDARNYGVKHSSEPLVTFIDSDDYVCPNYIESLLFALEDSNADVAAGNFKSVTGYISVRTSDRVKDYSLVEKEDFLENALCGKNGSLSAWGKLFKRPAVIDHPFPKGELYEDMEVIFTIYYNSSKIAFIDEDLYFYVSRDDSIVRSRFTEKHKYGVLSCIRMYNNYCNDRKLAKFLRFRIIKQACGHLRSLNAYSDRKMFSDLSKLIRPYVLGAMFSHAGMLKTRILAFSYCLPPRLGMFYSKILLGAKDIKRRHGQ